MANAKKRRKTRPYRDMEKVRAVLAETDSIVKEDGRPLASTLFCGGRRRPLEIECLKALVKKGEIGGVKIDRVRPWWNVMHGRSMYSFDIVCFNNKVAAVVEVKHTLCADDVRNFVSFRVPLFIELATEHSRDKEIVGAVIFSEVEDSKREDPVKLALDSGLIVVQAVNKNRLQDITSPDDVRRRQSVKGKRAAVKKR